MIDRFKPAMARKASITKNLAVLIATIGFAGSATLADAQTDPVARDLSVEQTAVYTVQAPAPSATVPDQLSVVAWVDREDNTYALGENVRLFVQTNRDAYLTVLNVGASGNTTVLFPNAGQQDTLVRGGKAVEIPAAGSGVSIKVSGPAVGRELIKVVASSEPITAFDPAQLVAAGAFSTLKSGARGAARDLSVVMKTATTARQYADYNKIITTVATRASMEPVVWPENILGLELAADRTGYRVGDTVTLYARSQQPCWLTLVNTGPSGQTRILIPNAMQPQYLLAPGQATALPGAGLSLTPMGPVGIETVTAFCSADERPLVLANLKYGREGFASLDTGNIGLSRDLVLAAAAPVQPVVQPVVAQATVGFLVTQQ